jgi:hypothetical protein
MNAPAPALRASAARRVTLQPWPTLVCPNGHRLAGLSQSLTESTHVCRHRLRNGSPCEWSVYVITDWRGEGEELLSLVVSVTREEITQMRRMPMRQKLIYLGLTQEVPRADQTR